MSSQVRILFVCLGNICRSPMAEALLRHHAKARGLEDIHIDSAGIGGWHAGQSPDSRMVSTAREHGVLLEGSARKLTPEDLESFDLILCSDAEILDQVKAVGASPARIELMLDYHPELCGENVPDPYYGGDDGFDRVYKMLDEASRGILDQIHDH